MQSAHPQAYTLLQAAVAEALRGARAVIVAGKLGPHLLRLAAAAGVEHLVLPSLAGVLRMVPMLSAYSHKPPL